MAVTVPLRLTAFTEEQLVELGQRMGQWLQQPQFRSVRVSTWMDMDLLWLRIVVDRASKRECSTSGSPAVRRHDDGA